MGRTRACAIAVALLAASLAMRVEAATYIAFSLRAAQQHIQQAGEGWRTSGPQVLNVAGINKVDGFVYDGQSGDLILVGEHDEGRASLTLDDLVVALQGHFRYNQWPLVSIDPMLDTAKTQVQHVRFDGGIEETAFGQALYDADYRLKQMAMGLEPPGVAGLRTVWDRNVEDVEGKTGPRGEEINSRFWLYPFTPHVVVREGVCVMRGMKVRVFAELLSTSSADKAVEDVKGFKAASFDAFANDVSGRFDELCQAQPSFNRLRGLQELVAVSNALEELEPRPDLSWWLERYSPARAETPKETKVLQRRYEGQRGRFEVSGEVRLTALATEINAGDVGGLREAVLRERPSAEALNWGFVVSEWMIPAVPGQAKPEDVAPLFAEAVFLQEQERHQEALGLYDRVLDINPRLAEAWSNKGWALRQLGRAQEALACYDRALETSPRLAGAWSNKGVALDALGRSQEALPCYDRALEISPLKVEAWNGKGVALRQLGRAQEALACYDRALEIAPGLAAPWCNKGWALVMLGRAEEALPCYDRALETKPRLAEAWFGKGAALHNLGRYVEARKAFEQAKALGFAQAGEALKLLQSEGH